MSEAINHGIELALKETVANGGASVSLSGQELPATGYMVGGYVESLIIPAELIDHGNHAWSQLLQFVNRHVAFATKYSTFLGGWLDSETNDYYFDFSIRFENRTDAIFEAIANEEIAIWDLEKGEEIRVS